MRILGDKNFPAAAGGVLLALLASGAALATEEAAPWWSGPRAGSILVEPALGYSQGDGLVGVNLSLRVSFPFEYMAVGVQGRSLFLPQGVLYQASLDVLGRWGPAFVGLALGGDFLPGDTGNPRLGLDILVGACLPLGIDGVFVQLYYRPSLVFLHSRTLVGHGVFLGLVFETGT